MVAKKQSNILIICTHFHADRSGKREKIPLQTMTGVHIGSMIDQNRYQVKLYHESWHGFYPTDRPDEVDLVFLTGLQKDFDRMRQIAYTFRKQGTTVVAGGSICTLFPEFATKFFDVVCVGGVEAVTNVLHDFEMGTLKNIYRSPQTQVSNYIADYSLLAKNGINPTLHFIETSRGCNFKCDFCVIPAEKAKHAIYHNDTIIQTIENVRKTTPKTSFRHWFPMIYFIDNNFSNNISYLTEICSYLKNASHIRAWGALVTQDLLRRHKILDMMAESKCRVLFTGIESFDTDFLKTHDKKQNLARTNELLDNIRRVQQKGIAIFYPYMFDPTTSSVAEMKQQLNLISGIEQVMVPLFFTTISPLAGTNLFWKEATEGTLLPQLRLRDLDGQAIAYRHTVDDMQSYTEFFTLLYTNTFKLYPKKQFFRKFFKLIKDNHWYNPLMLALLSMGSFNHIVDSYRQQRQVGRNYIGGLDVLDPPYYQLPTSISDEDKARYFDPILITDANSKLCNWLHRYQPI